MPNTDPRYVATQQILKSADEYLPTMLLKTTRAGATVGLTANCIDAGLVFLLIAPTKKISHETILLSPPLSEHPDANIEVLLSNHECKLNKLMMEKYPDTAKLPMLTLPKKCEGCEHFDRCDVTALIRSDPKDVAGIGITYQKLQAIMFSDSDVANMIKRRLVDCDVVIYDEAHIFESPDATNIEVYPSHRLDTYEETFKDNAKILPFLTKCNELLREKSVSIMELVHNHDDAETHLMSIKLKGSVEQPEFGEIIGAIKAVINVMKKRDKYGMTVEDVLYIFNVIMLFASEDHVLHYIKGEGGGKVLLSANDGLLPAIRIFRGMIDPSRSKKVIFTTATFGDFDYTHIFGFHNQVMMPDVMHTNQRVKIYPDTFKMDDINYRAKHWDRIIDAAHAYQKKYPGITFVCMKKNVARWLHKRLDERGVNINTDYYRSDKMIGVACDARRCVCVGSPVSPINAFDGVSATYDESQKRRIGNNHAAFWQAISRFKSPDGSEDTTVFCIGIREDAIKNMVTWGSERKLHIKNMACTGVDVTDAFPAPTIATKEDRTRKKVFLVIKANGGMTKTDLSIKLRMKAVELTKHLKYLVDHECIVVKTIKRKRQHVDFYAIS